MGYGDEILAAGQAQRWFDEHQTPVVIVGQDGLPRWHPIWEGNPAFAIPQGSERGRVHWWKHYHCIVNGPNARPYIHYPFTEDTGWTFNRLFKARDYIARIYLTKAELLFGASVAAGGPFILIDPWSKHANLRWPLDRWQRLVAERPLRVVQHTYPGAPVLAGVETIETPSFRLACAVLARAALYVRGESGMCHAAAALGIPNVVIWGACMDFDVLGGYPTQLGVGVHSPGDTCGSYRPCLHCVTTMAAITVAHVQRAIVCQLACYP